MYRKGAIFDGMYTKDEIVDDLHVDDEDNIEEEVSEVTVTEIDDLRNECMRETEEYINGRILQNHEVVHKRCSKKIKIPGWAFPSHFGQFLAMMDISGIIARCAIVLSQSHCRKR